MSIEDLQRSDIQHVSEWFGCSVSEVEVLIKVEPISIFKAQIEEMKSTFEEFKEDKFRTDRIVSLLIEGGKESYLYVEKEDPTKFVMEGRHRMVAFDLIGLKEVTVAYCSKRK